MVPVSTEVLIPVLIERAILGNKVNDLIMDFYKGIIWSNKVLFSSGLDLEEGS